MTPARGVRLDELLVRKPGAVDPARWPDERFHLYSIPAFDRGQPDILAGRDIRSTKQRVQPGDVLLSRIVPHVRRAWVVGPETGARLIASPEWLVLRHDRAHPPYLKHLLTGDAFHRQFMRTVSGVGGSLLRARPERVARIAIPLPSLDEQRRIARILDQAEALRTGRRDTLARLETLPPALYVELFGAPAANPRGWPSVALAELGDIQTGKTPPTQRPGMFQGDLPFVTPGDLDGGLVGTQRTLTPEGAAHSRVARAGSALVGCIGTIGKLARAPWRCAFNQQINAVQWGPDIDDAYGLVALAFARGQMRARSSSTTVPILNKSGFSRVTLWVPPLTLQREFARRMDEVDRMRTAQRASLAALDALFASLQERAVQERL